MKIKTCLVIVGPTAIGKSSVAIQLAKHFNTQIISADSRQCFRELNVGVAKPSKKDLQSVHHYFINSHSILQEVNAKLFEQYALQAAGEIFIDNDMAIMVGGTGLYVKAFCEGLDEVPEVNSEIRKKIILKYEQKGLEWLHAEVKKSDPEYFLNGEINNPQRMMRALEIKISTGRSILEFQSNKKIKRVFKIVKIGLELSKEKLHENIDNRIDAMIEQGLTDEVRALIPYQKLNALQTVGYKELFEYLEGSISLDKAIEKIKTNTRNYAKRQLTWFKKDREIKWINATTPLGEISESLQKVLSF